MKRLFALVGVAAVVVAVVGGCSKPSAPGKPSAASASATTSAAESSDSKGETGKTTSESTSTSGPAAAALPDPCTLLSDADVTNLTGRQISQIDKDGADAAASVRYCQWQLNSGQLAVFLSTTTKGDFETAKSAAEGATDVTGLGDGGYAASGHLYVLSGTIQLDVYVRGGSDEQNLADSKKVVETLLPKLKS